MASSSRVAIAGQAKAGSPGRMQIQAPALRNVDPQLLALAAR